MRWRVQGSSDCCDASLDVHKGWNSLSALADPNVCSTLPFLLTPWGPFTSTAGALQRSSSTTISTRLLDGMCCRLSRPWKTLVILTWVRLLLVVREVCQESIHCPTDWGTWFSWCLGFCRAPAAHSSEPSHIPGRATTLTNPSYPLSSNWAGTATSNLCLGQQTSAGSDFCKDNHSNSLVWNCCTFSFQYWVKEKRQVNMWA